MKRHEVLKIISENVSPDDLIFSTTGMISRELFAVGDRPQNFYLLGSMGLTSPLALAVAIIKPQKRVVAVEGDGSMLLNLGIIPAVSALKNRCRNFLLIVVDNGVYGSTGNQPTISSAVALEKIAKAAGFRNVERTTTRKTFQDSLGCLLKKTGPSFLLAKVDRSNLEKIPRISFSPNEIKERFIKILG